MYAPDFFFYTSKGGNAENFTNSEGSEISPDLQMSKLACHGVMDAGRRPKAPG